MNAATDNPALDMDALAVGLLAKHINWTRARIAEEVGFSLRYTYSLKKFPKFNEAWRFSRAADSGLPHGEVGGASGGHRLEAWEEG